MWRNTLNILRLSKIIWHLARFGALIPLHNISSRPTIYILSEFLWLIRNRDFENHRPGQRLAIALTTLGPSFIKFGQSLATRSDLIGEEIAQDLSQLQDRLPPFNFTEARKTIETELGKPLETFYKTIEKEPVAAASIAQVHYAITTENEPVAVKVLRPGIEAAMARDIELLSWVSEILEKQFPWIRRLRPVEVINVFSESVAIEMDMRLEAAAAAELSDNFSCDSNFKVPYVDWQRTSRRILTLEKLNGLRPDNVEALKNAGHDPIEILTKCASIFFNQVFRDGFFHADMHPGNLFILADGRIAPVDFGIMGRLDIQTRHFLADMLTGFLTGNYGRVAEVHFQAGYVPSHKSKEAFTQACRSIGEPIFGRPLAEISLARLLAQLFQITEQFEMQTQPQLLLLQKTMLVAEGVGRQLDDRVNIWELARPLIEKWVVENRSPQARLQQTTEQTFLFMERLPYLLEKTERSFNDFIDAGMRLHPATLEELANIQKPQRSLFWPIIIAVIAVSIIFAV